MQITSFPNEILFKIFKQTSIKDYASIARVSTKFYTAVNDNECWRDLVDPNYIPKDGGQVKQIFLNNLSSRKFKYIPVDQKGRIYLKIIELPADELVKKAKNDVEIAKIILENETLYEKIFEWHQFLTFNLKEIAISDISLAEVILTHPIFYKRFSENPNKKVASHHLKCIVEAYPTTRKLISENQELNELFLDKSGQMMHTIWKNRKAMAQLNHSQFFA